MELTDGGAVITDKNGKETIVPAVNSSIPHYYDENGEHYVNSSDIESTVDPYASEEYNYLALGSANCDDDMETQLSILSTRAFEPTAYPFENNIVSSEYTTINVISNMRNDVVNGYCSPRDFLDNVVEYIFEGKSVFNGRSVKPFQSLKPFSQITVVRLCQGVLQYCGDYYFNNGKTAYDGVIVASSLEPIEDELYVELTGRDYSNGR